MIMSHLPIDPEEMGKRKDHDLIASKNMVGEGAPIYDSISAEEEIQQLQEDPLPESYQ